jgi:hypothetical protein
LNLLGHNLSIPNNNTAISSNNSTTPNLNNSSSTNNNNNGNNISSGSSGSSSNTSLLSPKSPINQNNTSNIVPPGTLFALNSHLNHLGGLGLPLPHFPPVSLANFTGSGAPNNNHANNNTSANSGQQNNGKSHQHQQNSINNNERSTGAGGSGNFGSLKIFLHGCADIFRYSGFAVSLNLSDLMQFLQVLTSSATKTIYAYICIYIINF